MYDLPEIRGAVDALWRAISERLPGSPRRLTWDGDLRAQWTDPALTLGQTCSWPLVTELPHEVRVVGAFRYRGIEDLPGPLYRSVLVARSGRRLEELESGVAVVNGWDSTSGWLSLAHVVGRAGSDRSFFDRVIVSGSHEQSLELVSRGSADLASVDAVTFALVERHRPELVAGLDVVARGPSVPTLPLITAAPDPAPLRAAISAAVSDPGVEPVLEKLLIESFFAQDRADYAAVGRLGERARRILPPTPAGRA